MAYLTARTNLLESSKFLLNIIKFLLWLFQENDFLYFKQKYAQEDPWLVKSGLSDGQEKYCLKEVIFYLFSVFFFLKIRIALFTVCELNNIVGNKSPTQLKYNDRSILISLGESQLIIPTVTHTNDDGTVFTNDLLPSEARYQELCYIGDVLVNVTIKRNNSKRYGVVEVSDSCYKLSDILR